MGLMDKVRRRVASAVMPRPRAAGGYQFKGLDDPALLEYIRAGSVTTEAMKNMAVLRCVSLISTSIGMLPVNLIEEGPEKAVARDHAAHRLLKIKPNGWQTPYEFKSWAELCVLRKGNAYARVIWSAGRPVALIPMDPDSTKPRLTDDWQMVYDWTRKNGGTVTLSSKDVFHLRDISIDTVEGLSRMKLAESAIDLALQAQCAALRVFKTGVMAAGAIKIPDELSEEARDRVKKSLEEEYSGIENMHRWMLLEGGADAVKFAATAAEAQQAENREMQIAEVARAFGVPRPLLMMDETSWGSGIEQLGIYFIQYGLQHRLTAWEQALGRVLLSDREKETYQFKFNERALLRGTLKDQADFFAKALGSGGHAAWTTQNEVRELQDMPRSDDPEADKLRGPVSQKTKPKSGEDDEPETTA